MLRRLVCLSALLVIACDNPPPPAVDGGPPDASAGDAGVDAAASPDAYVPFEIAPHAAPMPVPRQSGPIMAHPQMVVITYADEPARAEIESDAAWLASSDWLATTGGEYGVGAATVLANVHLTANAPSVTSNDEIIAMLVAGIADHTFPAASDGTYDEVLYMVYFPESTRIHDANGLGDSCQSYGGYHYEAQTQDGHPFSYAVLPTCRGFSPALTLRESQEVSAAHELFEAATDPLPLTMPAWEFSESTFSPSPWLFVGAEIADLCALRVSSDVFVRDAGHVAPRIWSNAAAAANDRDPCQPADPAVPYSMVSVSPDTIVSATAGQTVTYTLTAWTSRPAPDFGLYAAVGGGTFNPPVSVSRTTVNNGDTATLTVDVPAGTPSQSYVLVYLEVVHSTSDYDSIPLVVYVP